VPARTAKRGDKLTEHSKPPELRFSYDPVQKALAAIYAATEVDKRRKAFRARINYFQRSKVLGDNVEVGKGKRKTYSTVQIERWLACLELTELGLSSITAGELITRHWAAFEPILRDAQASVVRDPGPDDIVLCIGGRLRHCSMRCWPMSENGSIASVSRCRPYVCFPPDSAGIADIPDRPAAPSPPWPPRLPAPMPGPPP
jgi:hypothetical protein